MRLELEALMDALAESGEKASAKKAANAVAVDRDARSALLADAVRARDAAVARGDAALRESEAAEAGLRAALAIISGVSAECSLLEAALSSLKTAASTGLSTLELESASLSASLTSLQVEHRSLSQERDGLASARSKLDAHVMGLEVELRAQIEAREWLVNSQRDTAQELATLKSEHTHLTGRMEELAGASAVLSRQLVGFGLLQGEQEGLSARIRELEDELYNALSEADTQKAAAERSSDDVAKCRASEAALRTIAVSLSLGGRALFRRLCLEPFPSYLLLLRERRVATTL